MQPRDEPVEDKSVSAKSVVRPRRSTVFGGAEFDRFFCGVEEM